MEKKHIKRARKDDENGPSKKWKREQHNSLRRLERRHEMIGYVGWGSYVGG